ncbi:YisL family protein [Peribacillus tepidiphilus]|uniref:YisL family protein n=1 Tax=Peribacillus tepidiphilus TaxID=2652445 RepID=UPI0012921DD6|nr:YisL family protein [Peribacillus tepidiphilus]
MTHMHITTWFVALILLFVALGLFKSGNQKGYKITHMILRVFYILIVATGVHLIAVTALTGAYVVKALLGIFVIGLMEVVLVRSVKGSIKGVMWILFIAALLIVIYYGLVLPQGFYIG